MNQSSSSKIKLAASEKSLLLEAFPEGIVALDLETTGLSPLVDRIIELSAIKITPDGNVETFDQLVHPGIPIPPATTEIHGITDDDVKNAPGIETVLPEFLEFLNDLPLIAHNAKFDVGYIVFDIFQNKLKLPQSKVYCSCQFARHVFPDMPSHRLGTLAEELNVPLENHHRALDDTAASLHIFAKSLEEQKKNTGKIKKFKAYLMKFPDFDKKMETVIPEHLKGLIKKLETQQIVDIKYAGGTHKNVWRPIRPVAFLPMPDGNILYAHCLLSDLYKSFMVRKITDYRELNAEEIRERAKALDK